MLSHKVHDAPAAVTLLEMPKGQRRGFRAPEAAAEKDGQDGAIAWVFVTNHKRRSVRSSGALSWRDMGT